MALAAAARLRGPPPLGQAAGRRWGWWGTRPGLRLATAAAGSGGGKDQTGVVTIEFCVK